MEVSLLLTRRECAEFLRISLSGLDRLIHDRERPLPKIKVGRRFLFEPGEVLRHLRAGAGTEEG